MIGSFVLPAYASLDLEQEYSPIGPESLRRYMSGRALKQMTYERTRITTSGNGWVPSGLQTLNYRAQHLLKCVRPETVPAAMPSRQTTLPVGRRSDPGHLPFALAQLDSGETVRASVSLVGDLATVDARPGAVAYQVGYYPQFTVYLMRPTRRGNAWELVAEEV